MEENELSPTVAERERKREGKEQRGKGEQRSVERGSAL